MDLPQFSKCRVLVVGDVMLDRYWYGDTSRISPEAPVPVVLVQNAVERPGGAGNVALNLAEIGCQVDLLSLTGDDRFADTLDTLMAQTTVDSQLMRMSGMPTITKIRIVGRSQQLIRIDFERKIPDEALDRLERAYRERLERADVVVISDYGKGNCLRSRQLIAMAQKKNIPVFVDPKSDNFADYFGASVITPNRKEFQAVVGRTETETELARKAQQQMQQHELAAILLTRGEHGMTLFEPDNEPIHLPTRAREVYDVTGAGDTVISILAAMQACGQSLVASATLANVAAGIVVRKLGTATVSLPELRRALTRQNHSELGVLDEAELMHAIKDARLRHETIVFTNGCFDILHPGHVAYLEEAKELGKRLIVAVNDDASVARLKGAGRPINRCRDRMAVVAALRSVDWVVPFKEDTPERLIKAIQPDFLVKGGDYQVDQIAGSDFVLASGGQVKIIEFRQGYSTSSTLAHIQQEAIQTK